MTSTLYRWGMLERSTYLSKDSIALRRFASSVCFCCFLTAACVEGVGGGGRGRENVAMPDNTMEC